MVAIYLVCENGHKLTVDVKDKNKFLKLCQLGKQVCSLCKPEDVRVSEYVPDQMSFKRDKNYACKHGHITEFEAFTSGWINIQWGDEYDNVKGLPQDVPEWIESRRITCNHGTLDKRGRRRKCGCKLKEVDDSILGYPHQVGIKTKIRVGDIWDREKCPEPRESSIEIEKRHGEYDAKVNVTEFSRRNKARLAQLRKERLTNPAGEVLKKPTNNRTDDKPSKNQVIKTSKKDYD